MLSFLFLHMRLMWRLYLQPLWLRAGYVPVEGATILYSVFGLQTRILFTYFQGYLIPTGYVAPFIEICGMINLSSIDSIVDSSIHIDNATKTPFALETVWILSLTDPCTDKPWPKVNQPNSLKSSSSEILMDVALCSECVVSVLDTVGSRLPCILLRIWQARWSICLSSDIWLIFRRFEERQ
jgi:hypothetical protein